MSCCRHCQDAEDVFDRSTAQSDLAGYRKHGPARQTRLLLDVLRREGVEGRSLLDIGGGVGAIQHELLKSGVAQATDVDASSAYIQAAKSEAERLGHAERVRYLHGDFVALAPELEAADIVTLDRVICCYPDMPALVGASAARAARLYGLVYPRDSWWARLGAPVLNVFLRFRYKAFRIYIHSSAEVEGVIRQQGLERRFHRYVGFWQVAVYGR